VSCRTGELELVGIYHAGYKDAQGLNVVVAVDQLREVLETRKAPRRDAARSDAQDRRRLLARLRAAPSPFFMPFADRTVRVAAQPGAVRFDVLDADFPLSSGVDIALVGRGDLAEPAAVVLPRSGDREVAWSTVEPALRDPAQRLHDALWRQLGHVLSFRDAEARGRDSPDARAALSSAAARVRGRRGDEKEILQAVDIEAEDLAWAAAEGDAQPTPSSEVAAERREGAR
jgi:serine protease Do